MLVIVSLQVSGSSMGQNVSECDVIPDQDAPAYTIGRTRRAPNEMPALTLLVTVKSGSYNPVSMRALGRTLNRTFCNDRTIEAIIFDDERAITKWDPIHLPELHAGSVRGSYLLDRDNGKEYLAFSNARGRGFDEFVSLGPNTEQPTPRTYANSYRNPNYAFSVVIPTSLAGTSTVPKEDECGINIPLSLDQHRYLWVGATDNSFQFSSVLWAVTFQRSWIEAEGATILSFTRDPHYRLGNLNATRLTVRYQLSGSAIVMVKDYVLALKQKKDEIGTLYRIEMGTTEQEYAQDKKIFEQLVRSWRSL